MGILLRVRIMLDFMTCIVTVNNLDFGSILNCATVVRITYSQHSSLNESRPQKLES